MIVIKNSEAEFIVDKSRFIAYLLAVNSENKAKDLLNETRKKYHNATHVCYAYRIANIERSSDDGEPSGTAGMPLLLFLKNKDLDNVLVMVVRYFGGIKLGTNGLVKAYSKAASLAYDNAKIAEVIMLNKYQITLAYDVAEKIRRLLIKNDHILDVIYDEEVTIIFTADENILNKIKEITQTPIKDLGLVALNRQIF